MASSKSPTQGLVLNVVIVACAIDSADKALLPATFKALSIQMNVGSAHLGYLAFAQNIAFSLALPMWGSMLQFYPARDLMAFGCFLWGTVTAMIAASSSYEVHFVLRLVVGAALAVVNPIGQAIICDVVPEAGRGRAFGMLQSVSAGVTMVVAGVTTSLSTQIIYGVWGWRLIYIVVAGVSCCTGFAVFSFVPARISGPPPVGKSSWLAEQTRIVKAVAGKPSFLIMVAQGVTGGIPWNAFAFLTLYFQVSGYTDIQVGQITFWGGLGGVFGGILGGVLGDFAARFSPFAGRCIVAQTSVALGTGLFMWFMSIPYGDYSLPILILAYFLFNVTSTWTGAAALRPICGTIFHDSRERAQVLALWIALEGVISSFLGAPLAGILSEYFGFKLVPGANSNDEVGGGTASAEALRKALIGVSLIPWIICALAWIPMYWTYPRDHAAVKAQRANFDDADTELTSSVSLDRASKSALE